MLAEKVSRMDLGFLSANLYKIGLEKFLELWRQGKAVLLDVRTEEEAQLVSLGFGLHIPLHKLPQNLSSIPKDKLVATFCPSRIRGAIAYAYLVSEGFDNVKVLATTIGELVESVKPEFVKNLKG